MIILTITLLLMSLYFLAFGAAFFNTRREMLQMTIDVNDGKEAEASTVLKTVGMTLFALLMIAINLVFFTLAFPVDVLRYPTIAMIIVGFVIPTIQGIVKSKFSKDTKETSKAKAIIELAKMKRWTVKGIFYGIIKVIYCGYILWLLMGDTV